MRVGGQNDLKPPIRGILKRRTFWNTELGVIFLNLHLIASKKNRHYDLLHMSNDSNGLAFELYNILEIFRIDAKWLEDRVYKWKSV